MQHRGGSRRASWDLARGSFPSGRVVHCLLVIIGLKPKPGHGRMTLLAVIELAAKEGIRTMQLRPGNTSLKLGHVQHSMYLTQNLSITPHLGTGIVNQQLSHWNDSSRSPLQLLALTSNWDNTFSSSSSGLKILHQAKSGLFARMGSACVQFALTGRTLHCVTKVGCSWNKRINLS